MALIKVPGRAKLYVNSRRLCSVDNLQIDVASNDIPQFTLCMGFAGFSNGPQMASGSFTAISFETGYETEFFGRVLGHQDVQVDIKYSNVIFTIEARFTNASLTSNTQSGETTAVTFAGKVTAYDPNLVPDPASLNL